MIGANISFQKEKNGYDRQQVDNYIKKISDAYQTTYYEFLDVSGKYKSLLEERENAPKQEIEEKQEKQEKREHSGGMNPDIAAKTLINTEMLAQKIITEAQTEAAAVIADAEKTIAEAKQEAAKMKERARKILDDANKEAEIAAERAKKNLAQARKIIEQAANQVEEVLSLEDEAFENDIAA